ncbi:hypothetical protein HG531_003973 [Fusarium graminearum]|nr:hypothetical protein HG531_003973 [Fusarium graminearum]
MRVDGIVQATVIARLVSSRESSLGGGCGARCLNLGSGGTSLSGTGLSSTSLGSTGVGSSGSLLDHNSGKSGALNQCAGLMLSLALRDDGRRLCAGRDRHNCSGNKSRLSRGGGNDGYR